MSTVKALLGDRRQTSTIKQRRKRARDRESREGCFRRGLGGTGGMTGLRREGAHLEEQPGKGSGRSLDRAEELGLVCLHLRTRKRGTAGREPLASLGRMEATWGFR